MALNKIIEVQSEQRATLMQKFLEAIFGVVSEPEELPGPEDYHSYPCRSHEMACRI